MCGDCNTHLGYIVYDCMCLVLGATEMREKMSNADARVIAAAAEPAGRCHSQCIDQESAGHAFKNGQ